MMAEGDRLRSLQMREARHDGFRMLFRALKEGRDEIGQRLLALLQLFLDPQAEIERHLVVARAGGMQAAGGGADERCKPRLDVHMDVFETAREFEIAALDL